MYLKHLRYQIRNLFTYFSFYWLQVSLALFAIFFVQVIQKNVEERIRVKGQEILGADISLSLRGKWEGSDDDILNLLRDYSERHTESLEASGMVTANDKSLLVNLMGIEEVYPLYGSIVTKPQVRWQEELEAKKVFVYQEVLDQMGIAIGDNLRLGDDEFEIAGVIEQEAVSGGFSALLPKVYVRKSHLEATTLIGPMSSEVRRILVQLKTDTQIAPVLELLKNEIINPAVRIRSSLNASEQSTRILDYLTDYMGLICVVAILLAFFGAIYLFRHFFFKQVQSLAIWKTLGFSASYINRVWIGQMTILALAISLSVYIFTKVLFPLLAPWLLKNISKDIPLSFYDSQIFTIFFFALFLSLSIHFLYSKNIFLLKPSYLLKQSKALDDLKTSRSVLLGITIVFIAFSFWLSRSWIVTIIFVSAVLGFFILSYILLKTLFYLLYRSKDRFLFLKYISINFYRNSTTYLFLMISLSFGFTLLSFLPSVKTSLLSQLEQREDRPRLFLFDIQDFQLESLQEDLKKDGFKLHSVSPLVRARLLKVNGKEVDLTFDDAELTREQEQANRFRNRAFNLSYRQELSKAEKIIKGKTFKDAKTDLPKVSLEKRFAARMGLSIGNILTFDIQDVEVEAEVVNLRSVNWFTFQPNFFVLFEDGVLNEAPKTYLATIATSDNTAGLQYEIASNFSNISIVDLDRVIEKVLDLSEDFEFVLSIMSYFSVILGIFVFLSIYIHFMERRKYEMQIMKTLGFSFRRVLLIGLSEYLLSLTYSVGIGLVIGTFLSYLLVVYFFDWSWTFDVKAVAWQSFLVLSVSFVLMVIFTLKDFIKKPISLLKSH